MRFSIAILVAATGAMLMTGGIAVASTVDRTPPPRPVGFAVSTDVRASAPAAVGR